MPSGARLDLRILWNGPQLDRLWMNSTLRSPHWSNADSSAGRSAPKSLQRVRRARSDRSPGVSSDAAPPARRGQDRARRRQRSPRHARPEAPPRASRCWSLRMGSAVGRPAIVFLEPSATRKRLALVDSLVDRFAVRGRAAVTWLRDPSPPPRPASCGSRSRAPADRRRGSACASAESDDWPLRPHVRGCPPSDNGRASVPRSPRAASVRVMIIWDAVIQLGPLRLGHCAPHAQHPTRERSTAREPTTRGHGPMARRTHRYTRAFPPPLSMDR
jgi:hypothetical protein